MYVRKNGLGLLLYTRWYY